MRETSYIEFVGLPGAGKTEVLRRVVARAGEKAIAMRVREPIQAGPFLKLRLFVCTAWFLVRHPALWTLCRVSVRPEYRSAPHIRSVVRNLRLRTLSDAVVVRYLLRRRSEPLANDEGLVGKVVALSVLTNLSEAQALRILSAVMPQPATVVFVEVEPRRAMEREQSRTIELPFFNDMDPASKERFFAESANVYQRFLSRWGSSQSLGVERLRNDGAIQELDGAIEGLLERLAAR